MRNDIAEFATNYTPRERGLIEFAWNGKHGNEFADANQDLRWAVIEFILGAPASVPLELIRDAALADSEWCREAWCAPRHFPALLSVLLTLGGKDALDDFATAMHSSFDTLGASHEIRIASELARELSAEASARIPGETDEGHAARLSGAAELFRKLIAGNATEGWVAVGPGTPISNVEVVELADDPPDEPPAKIQ